MNCALCNDDSTNTETCDKCSVNTRCEIYKAYQKKAIDLAIEVLIAGQTDATIRIILNKESDTGIIVARGAPQVAAIMKLIGEAGSSIIRKRFI